MHDNSHYVVARSLRIRTCSIPEKNEDCLCITGICAFECAMRNAVARQNAQQIEMFEHFNYAHSRPSIEGTPYGASPLYGASAQWQDRMLICGIEPEEDYGRV